MNYLQATTMEIKLNSEEKCFHSKCVSSVMKVCLMRTMNLEWVYKAQDVRNIPLKVQWIGHVRSI